MDDNNRLLPRDVFSVTLRGMCDNPGALHAESTVHTQDFYGNTESWIVQTFRVDGKETTFLQRNAADGNFRLVIPPEVTNAIAAQRDRITGRSRRRGARQALETKKAKGLPIGNAAALRKHTRREAGVRAAERRAKR